MGLTDLAAKAARWAACRRDGVHAPPPRPAPARDERIAEGMALVEEVARGVGRRIGGRVQFDDLIAIGHEALVAILRDHDPARAPFRAFAGTRLQWAILDGIRRETHSRTTLQIVSGLFDEDDAGVAARTPSPAPSPEEDVELDELVRAALDAAASLPPREHALVERHARGEDLQDIALDLGISKSWASRLHDRALARLRDTLDGRLCA